MLDIGESGLKRIGYLAQCAHADVDTLAENACIDDGLSEHCARLSLSTVFDVPLSREYLHALVERMVVAAAHEPAAAHACCMALLSRNAAPTPMPDRIPPPDARGIERAFGVQLGLLSPDDHAITRLASSGLVHERRVAARALAYRDVPGRLGLLEQLLGDPERSVTRVAASTCLSIGGGDVADVLFRQEQMFHLRLLGDPRARASVVKLVASKDPFDSDEAILSAHRLGDRDLLEQLWASSDWYRQCRALQASLQQQLLTEEEALSFVQGATADQLAELLEFWPEEQWSQAASLSSRFRGMTDVPVAAGSDLRAAPPGLRAAVMRIASPDRRHVLMERSLKDGDPALRASTIGLVGRLGCVEAFEPEILSACIDPDADVASRAVGVIIAQGYTRGLFGIDTAMLIRREDGRNPRLSQSLGLLTCVAERRVQDRC